MKGEPETGLEPGRKGRPGQPGKKKARYSWTGRRGLTRRLMASAGEAPHPPQSCLSADRLLVQGWELSAQACEAPS